MGSALARTLPPVVVDSAAAVGGRVAGRLLADRRRLIIRNLRRANPGLESPELPRLADAAFASYARYWAESFRLPDLSAERVDRSFSFTGYEHIARARAQGTGAIVALPHLGGWEWAAFWVALIAEIPVTAVVEPLEPPELFEWFVGFRESLGMNVVPLGPKVGGEVLKALRQGHVLCLLSDRDIGGGGVEVEFFGEQTTLPAGPATLAFRTGAPILPTAVYFDGQGHHGQVNPPLPVERKGRLRDDVTRVTQDLARSLEELISAAPDQWHLMSPNWPSDHHAPTTADAVR